MVINVGAVLLTTGSPGAARPPVVSISWARGSDGEVEIVVTDGSGEPVDLTGRTVAFGIRAADTSTSLLLGRAAVLTDAPAGVATVYLNAADTANLATGRYRYDVWLEDETGRHQIIKASPFVVIEAVLRVGDVPGAETPLAPMILGAVDTVNTTGRKLSAVDASRLDDGFLVYVIEKDAYYQVRIGLDLAVDHDTVETALGLADGQWKRFEVAATGGGGATILTRELVGDWTSGVGDPETVFPGSAKWVNLDRIDAAQLLATYSPTAKVSGGTGTLRVRLGGTRGLADGTVIATGTVTGTSYAGVEIDGAAFANPGGLTLVQVTFECTAGQTISVIDGAIEIRSSDAP